MIKLTKIILEMFEGVQMDDQNNMVINIIKSSDDGVGDDFIINREKKFTKVNKFPVYYGFSPNPNKDISEGELTQIFNHVKTKNSAIKDDELRKLMLLTVPSESKIDKIVVAESSSDLNTRMAKAIAQKFGLSDKDIIRANKRFMKVDDIINKARYEASDPVTRNMVDNFVKCIRKRFTDKNEELNLDSLTWAKRENGELVIQIKKSGYKDEDKRVCGIQSGGRRLLNSAFEMSGLEKAKNSNILVVDDFLVSGSSLREIFDILTNEVGTDPKKLKAYVLGSKSVK